MTGIGHNSNNISKADIKSLVDRIEELEAEKKSLQDHIKEIYAEAKESGVDTKALRQVIRRRQQDVVERLRLEEVIEAYTIALGELADTPLGKSALEHAGA